MRREEESKEGEEGGGKEGARGWKKTGGREPQPDCVELGLLLGRRAWE